jgi:hypothetical protein
MSAIEQQKILTSLINERGGGWRKAALMPWQ